MIRWTDYCDICIHGSSSGPNGLVAPNPLTGHLKIRIPDYPVYQVAGLSEVIHIQCATFT